MKNSENIKSKTLYIIGNGFDLHHGLLTTTADFYKFASNYLDDIAEFYSFNWSKSNPWYDFEDSLGLFDWNKFYEFHNNIDFTSEDFRLSFVFSLEDDIKEQADNCVENIRKLFQDWISGIDVSQVQKKMQLNDAAQFITFNYTLTLEAAYNINLDKILHIHGKVDDDIIFGHGEKIKKIPEFDKNGCSNRTMFSDAESVSNLPLYALQKPINDVLNMNKTFFDSLISIEEIFVIGHSLNDIDLLYFKEIVKQNPDAKWMIYLHKVRDKCHYTKKLLKCGVSNNKIDFCNYS